MAVNDGDTVVCLPPHLDTYLQKSIFHMLAEPCSCQRHLEVKLAEAVDSQRQMQNQVHVLLRRLEEAEAKCAKSREEASLNAQALRRQVADTQRLAVECKTLTKEVDSLTQECIRLEKECNLYHNDREVFMEAADEAEDRAAQAEERAEEANRRVEELLLELENIRRCSPQKYPATPERGEEMNRLRLKIADLEKELQRLQDKEIVTAHSRVESDEAYKLLQEQNSKLDSLLNATNQRYEETLMELRGVQEACTKIEATRKDERIVSSMVSSAISAGVFKALEQDRDEAISSLNLQFKAILKRMQGEFRASRERLLKKWTEGKGGQERLKLAEKGMKSLLLEAHALRQEISICKRNLDAAQKQVQLLAVENKDLRLLLRVKCNASMRYPVSPFVSRGNKCVTDAAFHDDFAAHGDYFSPAGPAFTNATHLAAYSFTQGYFTTMIASNYLFS